MMKHSFLLITAFLFSYCVFAQDAMTMLQFEDAEKAFNNGAYSEAIDKINAVESKTGVTSKTLYLRIITQDKQVEKDIKGQFSLIRELKTNTNKYLEALKNQEIDDKFRQVYAIKEKIDGYPETNPIEDYLKAVGRNKDQFDIKTVSIEYEVTFPAYNSQLQETVFMGIDKFYLKRVNEERFVLWKYKGDQGYTIISGDATLENDVQVQTKPAKKKSKKKERQEAPKNERVPLDATDLAAYKEGTSDGRHILGMVESILDIPEQYLISGSITSILPAKLEGTDIIGVVIDSAAIYAFDKNTHLLRYIEAGENSLTFKDYQTVGDQKFPFTIIKTEDNVQSIKKIKSLRFNEALPEDLFEDMD